VPIAVAPDSWLFSAHYSLLKFSMRFSLGVSRRDQLRHLEPARFEIFFLCVFLWFFFVRHWVTLKAVLVCLLKLEVSGCGAELGPGSSQASVLFFLL